MAGYGYHIKAEAHVRELFATFCRPELHYHNLEHTEKVVGNAILISTFESISPDSYDALLVACWFHDVGHLFGPPEGHEQRSVAQFRAFAEGNQLETKFTHVVESCILATRMPHNPHGILEEIICDADTFNLGTPEFVDTDRRLQLEMQIRKGKELKDWEQKTFDLLKNQRYFTSYGQQRLLKGLEANLEMLRERLSR